MQNPTPVAATLTPQTARDWLTPVELTVLAAVWGASFLFQRIAAPEFGAAPLVEMRLVFGALVLLPFLWLARARLPWRLWPRLALVAAINTAVPFLLFAWAAQRAPAGVGAITNAMAVLFTALVAFLFFRERIAPRKWFALVLGFIGVVVLASDRAVGGDVGPAAAAGATAAFLYGVGANLVPRWFAGLPPVAIAASTLVCGALMALPFAVAQWPQHPVSGAAWGSAVAVGVLSTGWAYALYYRLMHRVGAARAVSVTYLVPLMAVGWAWMFLGEALTWAMALACGLILVSVAVSQRRAVGQG